VAVVALAQERRSGGASGRTGGKSAPAVRKAPAARRAGRERPAAEMLLGLLERMFPDARIELEFQNPLELLVATILSAQSTDKTVNKVTVELFKKYRTAADYAAADPAVFEREIHSTGFFRAKTRSVLSAARMLVERFGGQVPSTMEDLVQLPGVARKTANVVLWGAFRKNEGVAVDTHVRRVAGRLGLASCDDPVKIEQDLMAYLPRDSWGRATELLIFLGRRTCRAARPDCAGCMLNKACPSSCV
jgi:endonuclease-3